MSDDRAVDLAALRAEYGDAGLDETNAGADPWQLWQRWFDEAAAAGLHEPNAMIVATVDTDGAPSARTVLLKGIGPDGFRFFTNTASRKGRALAHESRCALLFPWHPLERQVRVEGLARPLPVGDVAAYALGEGLGQLTPQAGVGEREVAAGPLDGGREGPRAGDLELEGARVAL